MNCNNFADIQSVLSAVVIVAAIWLELCVIAVVYGLFVHCRFISHVNVVHHVYNTTTWDGLVCNSHKSQQRVCCTTQYQLLEVTMSVCAANERKRQRNCFILTFFFALFISPVCLCLALLMAWNYENLFKHKTNSQSTEESERTNEPKNQRKKKTLNWNRIECVTHRTIK